MPTIAKETGQRLQPTQHLAQAGVDRVSAVTNMTRSRCLS